MRDVENQERVQLEIPALSDYARVVRLAVSGIASRLGFGYDDIEDLRIVVDEVLHAYVADDRTQTVEIECTVDDDALRARFSGPARTQPYALDDLGPPGIGDEIIDALVDDHTRLAEGETLHIRFEKRYPPRPHTT